MISKVVMHWLDATSVTREVSLADVAHLVVAKDSNEVPVAVTAYHLMEGHTVTYMGFISLEIVESQ